MGNLCPYQALRSVTQTISARVTIIYTTYGHTSLRAARQRLIASILSITPNISTARKLALVWGVYSAVSPDVHSQVAIAVGVPFAKSGTTNLLRIEEIGISGQ